MTKLRHPSPQAGFTVVELMVVLGILAMLAGLAISNSDKIFGNSQQAVARIFVTESLKLPLTRYNIDTGSFPTTAEGLQALVSAPANRAERWRGPYIEAPGGRLPVDPWGEPYLYRYPGTKNKEGYDVLSKGPDKTEGTADDIGNW
ncbi:MAG: type II secretion system major pseudopilin GspG [Opitutaceae bacterium]|nr:type II secretion system major pseudopilin GspG [Opitutaceae bacterium]